MSPKKKYCLAIITSFFNLTLGDNDNVFWVKLIMFSVCLCVGIVNYLFKFTPFKDLSVLQFNLQDLIKKVTSNWLTRYQFTFNASLQGDCNFFVC